MDEYDEITKDIPPMPDICVGEDAKKLREWILEFVQEIARRNEIILQKQGVEYDPNEIGLYQVYDFLKRVTQDADSCTEILFHYTNAVITYMLDGVMKYVRSAKIPEAMKPYLMIHLSQAFALNPLIANAIKDALVKHLFK